MKLRKWFKKCIGFFKNLFRPKKFHSVNGKSVDERIEQIIKEAASDK